MKKIVLIVFSWLSIISMYGQSYTISGYVTDSQTGEELLYSNIFVKELNKGVTTNEYGFYSLTLPKGQYSINYSYIGYQSQSKSINLDKNSQINIELSSGTKLNEVVISAEKNDVNIRSTEMGVDKIDIKQAKLIPVLFGEQDILKTIQLLPGVAANSEGSSGFFVRGGDVDQNLILLDEAPVYNASHLLGFFSVFNSDALKDVKLYKGGIPAQYGGRLSSVLDIRMKNGNMKKWTASGGIGLISSRLTLEGPISKDKGSIIISGRRTYADLLAKAFVDGFDDTALYFYDFNMKANYKLGDKDRIFLSGYFGRDVFSMQSAGMDWGNKTGTFRWNHVFTDKLFSNLALVYSDFNYGFGIDNAGTQVNLSSGIDDYSLKQDFHWYPNVNNKFQFGWSGSYHIFQPGEFSVDNDGSENIDINISQQKAFEGGIYIENDQKVSDKISLNYGLRLSSFSNIGEYNVKTYNDEDEIIDTKHYNKGEVYNSYFGLEPRFSGTFLLNNKSSIKASYHRAYQYMHLLSNSTSGTPTDIWTPSSPIIKPEIGDQIALGYFQNFKDNSWEFSIETYYKYLQDQVDYEDGANSFLNPDIEAELVFGIGKTYGAEFYLKKKKGKLTGWLSYTLSNSERKFDDINNGEWFSARQDRTHDISLVATYQLSKRLSLSGSWVYYTGDAVTFPTGKYEIDGEVINLFSSRNGNRMPDYHRLDLGITWQFKERKRWQSDVNLSIYNAYNRKNAYSITFQESETNLGSTEALKLSLFGIVPSITWNFRIK